MGDVALAIARRERDGDAAFSDGRVTPLGRREYLEQVPASGFKGVKSAVGRAQQAGFGDQTMRGEVGVNDPADRIRQ